MFYFYSFLFIVDTNNQKLTVAIFKLYRNCIYSYYVLKRYMR